MEVQIKRSTIIATSEPTSQSLELPLTVFDRYAPNIQVTVLFAFSPLTPTNSHLIDALTKTLLLHFPTLVARMGGSPHRPCLILGGGSDGVLVVEATIDSILEDHLPLLPSANMTRFSPSSTDPRKLLQVQLTRFRCGGLVVGVTAHHRVADGQSMSNFFVSWGRIARGLPIDRIPSYDLSWLRPLLPPKLEFEHWGVEFIRPPYSTKPFALDPAQVDPTRIANVLLRFSHEFIASELKAGLGVRFTTFEVLLAHVWRKLTAIRCLGRGDTTEVYVAVNGRRRLQPPVADEFFGNLVISACPSATVGELMDEGLAATARRVQNEVRRIDDAYFRSVINFGEEYKEAELVSIFEREGNLLSPNVEADSWLGFRFGEVDFGGGGALRGFIPAWIPQDGVVVFLPALGEKGGVDLVVALLEEHAEALKKISHTLR